MSQYDLTVIIPVCDSEERVAESAESIIQQMPSTSSVEIVLAARAADDTGENPCTELLQQHPFVTFAACEETRASHVKNAGMNAAQGRYLLFLNPGDTLAPGSIENIIRAFDACKDDVDIMSFPITYDDPKSIGAREHKKGTWMEEDGVYSINELPFVAQPTLNAVVKNGLDIFFDESLETNETPLFISTILAKNARIGFCKCVEYLCQSSESGAGLLKYNPLNAYDDTLLLFNALLDLADAHPDFCEYGRQAVLSQIDWRLNGNVLFPIHLQEDEFTREVDRLRTIVSRIPIQSIADSPYLSGQFKSYLIRFASPDISIEDIQPGEKGNLCVATMSDQSTWSMRTPIITTERLFEKNGALTLQGRLAWPGSPFFEEPTLTAVIGKDERVLNLTGSSYDYAAAKIKTAKIYHFELTIPDVVPSVKNIVFNADFEGHLFEKVHIYLSNLKRTNGRVLQSAIFFPTMLMRTKRRQLSIRLRRKKDVFEELSLSKSEEPQAAGIRAKYRLFKLKHSNEIWLYYDLPTSPQVGNGLAQFLHDHSKNDGIERYYVTSVGDQLLSQYPELSGKIIEHGSDTHLFAAVKAQVVLASYLERSIVFPFDNAMRNYLADLTYYQDMIYLQHGILHAHFPWYASKDRSIFDKIVTSSTFERRNLTSQYGYKETDLLETGAPRFDLIDPAKNEKTKKIIFAPSWRSFLIHGKSLNRIADTKAMEESSFYRGFKRFIELVSEKGILEKHGYTMDVKLHPNFEAYTDMFQFDAPNITLCDGPTNEDDYDLVITDFSSYVYDFLFLGKSALYFIPDAAELHAGFNHYWKLDLAPDELFGPYSETAEQAVEGLDRCLHALAHGESTEYDDRRNSFFIHRDQNNRERLYRALTNA